MDNARDTQCQHNSRQGVSRTWQIEVVSVSATGNNTTEPLIKKGINRGNLTLWIDDKVIAAWHGEHTNGWRGRDYKYSTLAID